MKQRHSRYNEVMDILNPPKEEQNLDTDGGDAVQYQQRNYSHEVRYDDENANREEAQNAATGLAGKQNTARSGGTLSPATAEKIWQGIGREKQEQIIDQLDLYTYISEEADLYLFGSADASSLDARTNILEETAKQFYAAMHADRILLENDGRFRWLGENISLLINDIESIEAGTFSIDEDFEQYQQRHKVLTNREVLEMAMNDLQLSDLTPGERTALDILKGRLEHLKDLQGQRKQQGETYREQQFGTKVDRTAAEQTRNRMKVLDGRIQKAEAAVLAVENKQVLKTVLQKARKVVEKQLWAKDEQKLKRWKQSRNSSGPIGGNKIGKRVDKSRTKPVQKQRIFLLSRISTMYCLFSVTAHGRRFTPWITSTYPQTKKLPRLQSGSVAGFGSSFFKSTLGSHHYPIACGDTLHALTCRAAGKHIQSYLHSLCGVFGTSDNADHFHLVFCHDISSRLLLTWRGDLPIMMVSPLVG